MIILNKRSATEKGVILFGPDIWGALKQMRLGKHIKKRFPTRIGQLLGKQMPAPITYMMDTLDDALEDTAQSKKGQLTYMWARKLANAENMPQASIIEILRAAGKRLMQTSPYTRQAARKTERARDAVPVGGLPKLPSVQLLNP